MVSIVITLILLNYIKVDIIQNSAITKEFEPKKQTSNTKTVIVVKAVLYL